MSVSGSTSDLTPPPICSPRLPDLPDLPSYVVFEEVTCMFFDEDANTWRASGIADVGTEGSATGARSVVCGSTHATAFSVAQAPPHSNSSATLAQPASKSEDLYVKCPRPSAVCWASLMVFVPVCDTQPD